MSAKQYSKKNKRTEISLSSQENHELQMILDRLAVQDPHGESLQSYLQSLARTLLGRTGLVTALLDKLSRDPTPVGFLVFSTFQDMVKDKEFKRTIKQAAYRFSQKGYTKERGSSPESVVLIPKESRQVITHMVPAPDVDWFVAGFFSGEAGSESVALSAYSENRFRELSIRVVESSPKLYREFIQKIADHIPDSAPFTVPPWHAARIYFEMLQFHGEKDVPHEAEQARKILQPFYVAEKLPYSHQLFQAIEEPERRFQELDTRTLLESMAVITLCLSKEDLDPYYQKLQELDRSVLLVRKEIQQERAMELLRKAAEELCTGPTRLMYIRLFEEHAVALRQQKKHDLAEQAWIVAQHLSGPGDAGDNPVMNEIIAMSIQSHWPSEFDGEPQQGSPYEQTESGLILPR